MNPGKVILLRIEGGGHIACNEYNPADNGRLHMLDKNKYANFYRNAMELEYKKTSLTIAEVVYEGENWPDEIRNCQDAVRIMTHFGVS